jgi:hypothetical protein
MYFLHIYDRGRLVADDQGIDAETLQDARVEAFRVITELFGSQTWDRVRHAANYIEIADRTGAVLDIVAVWEVVSRPQP